MSLSAPQSSDNLDTHRRSQSGQASDFVSDGIAIQHELDSFGFVAPAAFAFATCALSLAACFYSAPTSESDLILWGASYGPRTLHEYWRMVSALFLTTNLHTLYFNVLATFVLGRALSRAMGSLFFCAVFLSSGAAAVVASSLLEPQAVIFGSTLAVAGLAGALFSCFFAGRFRRKLNPEAIGFLALYLLVMVYATALGRGELTAEVFAVSFCSGLACALLLGFGSRYAVAPLAGLGLLVFAFHFALGSLPGSIDRFAANAAIDSLHIQTSHELKLLEEKFRRGDLSELEFQNQLNIRLLQPSRYVLAKISSVPERELDPTWLHHSKSDLEYRRIAIESMLSVYSSRSSLLIAEEKITQADDQALKLLDVFWAEQLPTLRSKRDKADALLHEYKEVGAKLIALERGLDADWRALTDAALSLEIARTEIWLTQLREDVLNFEERRPSSSGSSNDPPSSQLADGFAQQQLTQILRYQSRLEIAAQGIRASPLGHSARLRRLQDHLNQMVSAARATIEIPGVAPAIRK